MQKMNKTIWVDVETTGLDSATDRIIELAALFGDGDDEGNTFHCYCRQQSDDPPEGFELITKITGITWDFLQENGIPDSQMFGDFINWLELKINRYDRNDKAIFAAYSVGFDDGFLRELFVRNDDPFFGSWFSGRMDIMSTVVMAERMGVLKLKNRKLVTVAKELNIPLVDAHNALGDIRAARSVQIELEQIIIGLGERM